MNWLRQHLDALTHNTPDKREQAERVARLKRDRKNIAAFWNSVAKNLKDDTRDFSGMRTYLTRGVAEDLKAFLPCLEIGLAETPDPVVMGVPLMQVYFTHTQAFDVLIDRRLVFPWREEHKMLAVALEGGLQVTPQLCEFFVGCCEQNTGLSIRLSGIPTPKAGAGHDYPDVNTLSSVRMAKQFNSPRPAGELSDKFVAGAQLLEVFGADWTHVSSNGLRLGERLYTCLGAPHRQAFAQYAPLSSETIDVGQIVAERMRANSVERSNAPRLKL